MSACCAYEVIAITSDRVPTITRLCREHRWAEAILFAGLVTHLHIEKKERLGV